MSDCAEAASPAAPSAPRADARAARLEKFKREQLIVDDLNRGVSLAEIAARIGIGEKRMRAVIREILARRMPAPPEEFVAIQVSRLNEALLVACSAMGEMNLKAVDRVVRIVREFDRYHGFCAAGRRLPEPSVRDLEAPAEGTLAFGAALVCRPEFALQDYEMVEFAPGIAADSNAAGSVKEAQKDQAFASIRRSEQRPAAPGAPFGSRPEVLPEPLGKVESAPGIVGGPESAGCEDASRDQVRASAHPAFHAPLNDRPDSRGAPLDLILTPAPRPKSLSEDVSLRSDVAARCGLLRDATLLGVTAEGRLLPSRRATTARKTCRKILKTLNLRPGIFGAAERLHPSKRRAQPDFS